MATVGVLFLKKIFFLVPILALVYGGEDKSCEKNERGKISLVPAIQDGLYGYKYSDSDEWAINPEFDEAHYFRHDTAIVGKQKRKGKIYNIIDTDGTLMVPIDANRVILGRNERILTLLKDDGAGYYNMMTKEFTGLVYKKANIFNHYGTAKRDGRWFVLTEGFDEIALGDTIEDIGIYGDGLLPFKKEDKWGYISLDGREIIENKFTNAYSFRRGVAAVKYNGRYQVIGTDGDFLLVGEEGTKYMVTSSGKIIYLKDGGCGLIKATGKEVFSKSDVPILLEFGEVFLFFSGNSNNRKLGIINKKGEILIEAQNETVVDFYQGKVLLSSGKEIFIEE